VLHYFLDIGIETKNTSIETIKNPKAFVAASPSSTTKANTAATIISTKYPIDHNDRINLLPNLLKILLNYKILCG